MDARAVRRFSTRAWKDVSDSKRAYWAERFRREGWMSVWTAAQGLLAYARRIRPDFPSARERDQDLSDHSTQRTRLERAAHAFTRR